MTLRRAIGPGLALVLMAPVAAQPAPATATATDTATATATHGNATQRRYPAEADVALGAPASGDQPSVTPVSGNQAPGPQALMQAALTLMQAAADQATQGDFPGAVAGYARAAGIWHTLGNRDLQAAVTFALGQAQRKAGNASAAQAAYEAVLALSPGAAMHDHAVDALAVVAYGRGDYPRALAYAEQALPHFQAPTMAAARANLLLLAGEAAAGMHDNARALRDYAAAEALGPVNPTARASAFAAQSEVVTEQGDPARGAVLARLAVTLLDQLHYAAGADKARNDLGTALTGMGRRDEALAIYTGLLKSAQARNDPQATAVAFTTTGDVHLSFGDLADAAAQFRLAIAWSRRAGDPDTEATATAELGMALHGLGDDGEATRQLNAAIALRQAAHDRRGEAIERNDLATVKGDGGDLQAALDIYEQSRTVFAGMADAADEAACLGNIGGIYRTLGARDEARRYYAQAAAIDRRLDDQESLAAVLNNLAVLDQESGRPADALDDDSRALAIQTRLGNRLAQAGLLSGMAMARDTMGEHAAAVSLLTQSLDLARRAGSPNGEALALHNRGTVRVALGDPAGARADLQAAIPFWRQTGSAVGEASALGVIARIEAAQGRTRAALADVGASIALYESARGRIASADLRAGFLQRAAAAYALRVELLMRLDAAEPGQGHAADALEAAEAARARSLLDLLGEAQAGLLRHADPAAVARLAAIRRALSARDAQRGRIGPDTPDGAAIARQIDELMAEQDRVHAALQAANPAYAALTSQAPMTAARVQALLDPGTVLLDIALGEARSFLWVVSPSAVHAYALPARTTLLDGANALRDAIGDPDDAGRFTTASAALGRLLLGPAAAEIAGKRLVVVADAALQSRVPFAALTVDGHLVVETHEVVSEPSVAALAALRRMSEGRPHPPRTLAVLADPVVSPDDARLPAGPHAPPGGVLLAASGGSLARLPETRTEADAILALVAPGARLARFGFEATREAAEDPSLASYRIVHFATHGLVDRRMPALSGLVLAEFAPDGTPRDGYLRLGDVFGLALPVDLVVLSACGTGLGRDAGDEGLVGLARGFFYAGAARVVTTLWDIEDASTAAFMARFYAGMLGPARQTPAAALRGAQLASLAHGQTRAPARWAAFTIQGEWR